MTQVCFFYQNSQIISSSVDYQPKKYIPFLRSNQVDEVSETGGKFSKRCFKIVLKTGAVEQFKCPAKEVRETHVYNMLYCKAI